jgi:2-oxo-4-hydroxy-4-carboxy--5-ureidoimidazoline (OHCU) decarboxylase
MEYSATYGNAARAAAQAGNLDLAKKYADMSGKLAQASVNMLCDLSEDVRKAYRDAGVNCPLSDKERAAQSQAGENKVRQEAVAKGESLDPFVRSREGLPPLQSVASK